MTIMSAKNIESVPRQEEHTVCTPKKNFVALGVWLQFHNCGAGKNTDSEGNCPIDCATCKKENAKLANHPFQPIEYGSSKNCHDAYGSSQSCDKRPPLVIWLLKYLHGVREQFTKRPSYDGACGKMYITLKNEPRACALIKRTLLSDRPHVWKYEYYCSKEVSVLAREQCSIVSRHSVDAASTTAEEAREHSGPSDDTSINIKSHGLVASDHLVPTQIHAPPHMQVKVEDAITMDAVPSSSACSDISHERLETKCSDLNRLEYFASMPQLPETDATVPTREVQSCTSLDDFPDLLGHAGCATANDWRLGSDNASIVPDVTAHDSSHESVEQNYFRYNHPNLDCAGGQDGQYLSTSGQISQSFLNDANIARDSSTETAFPHPLNFTMNSGVFAVGSSMYSSALDVCSEVFPTGQYEQSSAPRFQDQRGKHIKHIDVLPYTPDACSRQHRYPNPPGTPIKRRSQSDAAKLSRAVRRAIQLPSTAANF
eukprot:m.74151 g.74151  ORF g.74151 m.74151 type:complete len:485 (-) comp16152_c0_seq1:95-1549(-)